MERRNTIQRALVGEAVKGLDHPDAEEVFEAVAAGHPHISKATVYRNLNLLAEEGAIGRVRLCAGADRFDSRTLPHYHMRCRACGKVFDAPLPPIAPEAMLGDTGGFAVEGHILEFTGLCAGCKKS